MFSSKGSRLVVSSAGLALFSLAVTFGLLTISDKLVVRPLEGLENQIFDLAFNIREYNPAPMAVTPDDVVIVDIDDASIERLGRTQLWPRSFDARVISHIGKGKPRGIGVDYIYSEADTLTRAYAGLLQAKGFQDADGILRALSTDNELAQAIRETGCVYLAVFDDDSKKSAFPDSITASIRTFRVADTFGRDFPKTTYPTLPIVPFREAAKAVGAITMPSMRDGTVRYYRLLQRMPESSDAYLGEFTLYMAADALGVPDSEVAVTEKGIRVGPVEMPLRANGSFRINWLGKKQPVRYVSYYKVLEGRIDPAFFENKFVFLGTSASGLQDLKSVPSQESKMPGVEVHVHAFLNLINAAHFTEYSSFELLPLFAIVTFVLVFFYQMLKPAYGLAAMFVLGAANIFGFVLSVYEGSLVLYPVITVTMIIFFGYISSALYNYFTEEKEKKRIKGAFGTYVSPEVVEEILQNQGELKLGGQKKVLTVLFSDIRGFTTYSEKLDPQELVSILNGYLSRMNDVVFNHRGTIDKFIGDAVMAIFGAPVPQNDHADRACRVAVDMIKELEEVNKEQRAKGEQDLHIGIGLNTGEMTVGNIGSSKRFDYTVIGDAVNLGSRLEGLTKFFGVDILVSETTKAACTTNEFVFRELAPVKVKGKDKAMVVYDLIGLKQDEAKYKPFLDVWNPAYEAYKEQRLEEAEKGFKACQELRPNDAMTRYYLEQIALAKADPSSFHAIIKMDTK
jgi:adenylate cyclase